MNIRGIWSKIYGEERRSPVWGAIRIAAGVFLILTVLPPISLRVMNFFILIPPAIGFILIFLPGILALLQGISGRHYRALLIFLKAVILVSCVFFFAEFCLIFSNSYRQNVPADTVAIVLGAKVEGNVPSIDLLGRISAAGSYLKSHPDAICIASGGQGKDENISEAQCIRDYLVNHNGVESSRIYLDDTSVNTIQNLRNSLTIIKNNGFPDRIAIISDGFHMYRAKMLASRIGITAYGWPAQTDWRLNLFLYIREMIALPKSFIVDR